MSTPADIILNDGDLKGTLPANFLYGASSASYQIEGCTSADGRSDCVWDEVLRDAKDSGADACNSYEQWREDVQLVEDYGLNTYRFSIAWSRIRPKGGRNDPVNEAGIKYYSDLIDALLAQGIQPAVTIFHWDHPLELQQRYGGFQNEEEIVQDFVAYAEALFERLGDRVKFWITINEPQIFSCLSSMTFAKDTWDHETSWTSLSRVLLLCHAKTVDLYRREYQPKQGAKIGITHNADWVEPLDPSNPESVKAAENILHHSLSLHADPIYLGKYPQYLQEEFGDNLPSFSDQEWSLIKGSSEFFGLNHYGTSYATGKRLTREDAIPFRIGFGNYETTFFRDGKAIGVRGHNEHPYTVPWGFRKLLNYIHKRYLTNTNLAIYITENGFPVENEGDMSLEQALKDTQRQEYYASYIREMVLAHKEDGVRMGGYMAWSLLDNLEWVFGYAPRFGITAIDRQNGFKRHPKESAYMLGKLFEHVVSK